MMDFENIQPLNTITSRKASINGCIYDVLDYEEYRKDLSCNIDRTDIAVLEDYKDQQILLPYKGKYSGNPVSPGIYNAGCIDFIKYPDNITKHNYIPEKIISLSNVSDIDEIIKNGEIISKLDESFVTTPDNITNVIIKESDQPELKALKMAINAKQIDLDKYQGRFGANYPNDKRQLKSNSITLNILKRYCDNCDMEAVLTIRDKSPDVPNPIGREISVSLTENMEGCNENFYIDDTDIDKSSIIDLDDDQYNEEEVT